MSFAMCNAKLKALAGSSPEQFADLRDSLIQEAIAGFGRPDNGERLQHQIDSLRWSKGGGVSASVALLHELNSSLREFDGLLRKYEEALDELESRNENCG